MHHVHENMLFWGYGECPCEGAECFDYVPDDGFDFDYDKE